MPPCNLYQSANSSVWALPPMAQPDSVDVWLSHPAISNKLKKIETYPVLPPGRELQGYSDMLEQTGNLVLQRLAKKARAGRADAVIAMGLVPSNVAKGPAEFIGHGTAVRVVD